MNHEASDEEMLSHMITFEPPPPGYPLTASHHLLRKYGYPHRPDPDKEPRLSKLCQETFSRPHQIIRAELQVGPLKTSPCAAAFKAALVWPPGSVGRRRSVQGSFGTPFRRAD
jgi:hypothetical protein